MTIHDSTYERRESDFYPTLDAELCVPAILPYLDALKPVWEPHAGQGHLVQALEDRGFSVVPSDLNGCADAEWLGLTDLKSGHDFFGPAPADHPTQIVMNPPYSDIDAHVARALELAHTVCLLARSDWSYAASRKPVLSRLRVKVELCWRLKWVEGGPSSGKHNYAWYVWSRSPFQPRLVSYYKPK